jgi:hypothetical protein
MKGIYFKKFREIRSICESGGMKDPNKLDEIHRISDEMVCFIEDPIKYPLQ